VCVQAAYVPQERNHATECRGMVASVIMKVKKPVIVPVVETVEKAIGVSVVKQVDIL